MIPTCLLLQTVGPQKWGMCLPNPQCVPKAQPVFMKMKGTFSLSLPRSLVSTLLLNIIDPKISS